jgi:regulatory protein
MNANNTYTVEEAKKRLERYCVYQERCHKEVNKKLYEMRMIPLAIDEIIDHLLRHNFLNETRFAQAFARGKFRTKKWGRNRIVNELKMRQISKFNIKIALKEIPDSEYYKTFEALAEKRLQQLASEENLQKKRKKLADYLFYRGWESELVYGKVNEISK